MKSGIFCLLQEEKHNKLENQSEDETTYIKHHSSLETEPVLKSRKPAWEDEDDLAQM